MTVTTEWALQADTLASMTVGGVVFENVITTVHWRCVGTDGEIQVKVYGSTDVPPPTSQASYIDVSSLLGMDAETRRATVLGWAEAIKPSLEADIVAQVIARIEAEIAEPAKSSVTVLP